MSTLHRIILRRSPFNDERPTLDFLSNKCKILIIGAGGLGCELLKDIALMGVRDIHVIDMDTIELSNLNRQFLFRASDIGKSKAEVAARFINRMLPGCEVVAHHNRIQDFDAKFYHSFNIIISGLDSIEARRWINNVVVGLLSYNDDGNVDPSTIIPLIDGGTEGLKGNARIVLPGITACIECNLDLYPPPVNYPICTLANKPRLPEHTIEYVKTLLWPKENPFGDGVQLNEEDPKHIHWIHEKSVERAKEFSIEPPSLRFTQDVLKRTIAAVSSTNACIAATCAMEAFKLITSCCEPMNNFQILNLSSGIYSYVFEAERNPDCHVCGKPNVLVTSNSDEQKPNSSN